jgi:hypothetical protein
MRRVYIGWLCAGLLFNLVSCKSDDADSADAANSADAQGNQNDGGTSCEGATTDGILGKWGIILLGGGDAPGGGTTISVRGTYHFCGPTSSGTFRYTEAGLHTPGRDCRHVRDRSGTFTYDGATLALTTNDALSGAYDCADPSQNHEQKSTTPSTRSYPAMVSGNQLTIEDGAIPSSVYTRK